MTAQALHFDTDPAWIEAIRAWAVSVPQVSGVWLFGSRVTGVRRPKDDAPIIPDLDVAYTLASSRLEKGELLGLSLFKQPGWHKALQAHIQVPLELHLADPEEDQAVWPAVLDHGVRIYTRPDVPICPDPEA